MKNHIPENNRQTSLYRAISKKITAIWFAFGRLDAGNFLPLMIAVFCLFFVASCGLITRNFATGDSSSSNGLNAADTNVSNADTENPTGYDKEKFQKLLDAKTEIEKMSLPVKLDPKPTLKGKVYVFGNVQAGLAKGYDDGISSYRKANSLEELQTAIRINCRRGKSLGKFQGNTNGIISRAEGYGIECDVALIDYPARVVFDQKTFSNNESQDLISNREVTAGVYLNPPPVGEITRYINSLPVDKIIPGMTSLDEKELIKLPTTIGLKPGAGLKGKIKFARQYEESGFSQTRVKIDGYLGSSFPFDKLTTNPEELETLVKIVCGKGDKIGQSGRTTQYSNRCEISLIDYKTLTVVSQKIVENKTLDTNPSAKDANVKIWVTKLPEAEIENYLKSLPTS
jgi:hypothetical protein